MIRLLLDQGLPRSAVASLGADGWDVVHVADLGLSTASDEEILEHARKDSRAVCTLDADLHTLVAVSGATAPSVVRLRRQGLRGPDVAALLKTVWAEAGASIEKGALVTVTETAVRLRLLPLDGA